MSDRLTCPEPQCQLQLNEQELIAHLQWDHNYRETEAERLVQGVTE